MPIALASAEPASAIQASVHRRVSRASIEKPTPKTSASQQKIRDGNAMPALIAVSSPINTSTPRAAPVCGRMNETSSTIGAE